MTFFCPHCSRGLEQTGQTNRFVCVGCRKMYEVRIELRELDRIFDDGNLRKPALSESNSGGSKD